MEPFVLIAVIVVFFGAIAYLRSVSRIVVYEFQKGLLYKKGSFVKLLGPGQYRFIKPKTDIQLIDVRRQLVLLPGQDILTKDNISLKFSLCGFIEVTDPVKAKHQTTNYLNEFYNHA